VIQEFPTLAQQLGETFFSDKLVHFLLTWLSYPIYAVRESSILALKQIGKMFGTQWTIKHTIPQFQTFTNESNYLY
jgi:serine/threonine-protein phosphatase 2A regulatory subunit A